MFRNANDANPCPTVISSGAEEAWLVADVNAASGTRVIVIEIDCGVTSWSVNEHKTRCADMYDGQ